MAQVYSQEVRDNIVKLRKDGLTYPQIAEKLGIQHSSSLWRICATDGKTKGRFVTDDEKDTVTRMFKEGASRHEIADAIGKSYSFVVAYINNCGCTRTNPNKEFYAKMCEYKAQGHTIKETAQHFNVSMTKAGTVCKGVSPQNNTQYTKVCAICGREFMTERYNTRYCSSVCRNTKRDWKHNHRVSEDKRIDKGINARSLYKRDKGVCWICGRQCDLNDYITKNGYFVAGDWYPSVDHIVPVCDGGTDEWTNVKLAHRICNSRRFYAEKTNPIA